ncbi:Transcription elongation factor GreA [bioreactor metagenome]|uniref:Transcription elongation factor GreA n=1 Tax=bioreactor metagenome TaxID=1076179 RepID=A0A645HI34_9ZZZZ
MSNTVYLTKEKMKELEDEYQYLTTVARKEIAQKIAEARSHGDLSENADYDAAKDEQGLLELRISQIGEMLAKSQIISSSDFPTDKVYILSTVKLKNYRTNVIDDYTLVSAAEADFEKNKIAVTSPLGKALMGKSVGDIFEIKIPAGINKYEILNIGKS